MINTIKTVVFLFFFSTGIFIGGCHKAPRQASRAFYYWKTSFAVSSAQKQRLQDLGVKKLYTRFFDVTIDDAGNAVPAARLIIDSAFPAGTSIIPVVFITNKTMEKQDAGTISALAGNILSLIDKIAAESGIHYEELQFDCDWSAGTRINYFKLLDEIKKKIAGTKIILSCTIRLHQVKYFRKTGLPPVDRGMLMFYNMGKLPDTVSNSIFNKEDASNYVAAIKKYPLPLDVALPVFSWIKQYRDRRIHRLLNNMNETMLTESDFFVRVSNLHYRAVKDGFFHGEYIRNGDHFVVEEITPDLAKKAAALLEDNFTADNFTVVLYHLDEANLSRYANKDLEDIYHYFE